MAKFDVNRRANTNLYDLVDRFFNDGFSINTPLKNIILDVQEFDDRYVVEADVPGVDKKDINVSFNNDYLKIALEHSEEADDEEAVEEVDDTKEKKKSTAAADEDHYIHRERTYASVNRVVYLKGATSKNIKAELKDGVLTLIVPKRDDAMDKNQRIDIE